MARQVLILNATAGALAANPSMTRSEFEDYYHGLERSEASGLPVSIGYSIFRPANRADEIRQDAERRGGRRFQSRAPSGDEAHGVVLIQPERGENARALGFDMHAEPTRRAAMDRARRIGSPAMTSRVVLAIDKGSKVPSFLIYAPVREGRRTVGLAFVGVRAKALFGELRGSFERAQVGVRLWSRSATPEGLVYVYGIKPETGVGRPRPLVLSEVGQELLCEYVPLPEFGTPTVVRRFLIPAGVGLSGLLFLLSLLLFRSGETAERRSEAQALLAGIGRLAVSTVEEEALVQGVVRLIESALHAECAIDLLRDGEEPATEGGIAIPFSTKRVAAPLGLGDREIGRIVLARTAPARPFTREDATLLQEIAGRLALAIDNVRLYYGLELMVAERTRELEASNAELESFCYSVSHDLRTPLRSLDGFSQVLQEDYGPSLDAEANDHIRRIRAAANRMDELITSLLNLSRLTRAEIAPRQIDAAEIARQVAADLDPTRRILFEIDEEIPVFADRRLLQSLLENLIGNAVKFSSRKKSPEVRIGKGRNAGEIVVADNGAGFEMAYAAKLFQPFERLHTVREFPGHGIGLATVERIVRRHGGWVQAEGRLGDGATFTVSFPPREPSATHESDSLA